MTSIRNVPDLQSSALGHRHPRIDLGPAGRRLCVAELHDTHLSKYGTGSQWGHLDRPLEPEISAVDTDTDWAGNLIDAQSGTASLSVAAWWHFS